MKDLKGQRYAELQNAFRHQREYVSDCTCRGNPWDDEARARHRAYAEAELKGKALAATKKARGENRQSSGRGRDGQRTQRWARSGWDDHEGRDD